MSQPIKNIYSKCRVCYLVILSSKAFSPKEIKHLMCTNKSNMIGATSCFTSEEMSSISSCAVVVVQYLVFYTVLCVFWMYFLFFYDIFSLFLTFELECPFTVFFFFMSFCNHETKTMGDNYKRNDFNVLDYISENFSGHMISNSLKNPMLVFCETEKKVWKFRIL